MPSQHWTYEDNEDDSTAPAGGNDLWSTATAKAPAPLSTSDKLKQPPTTLRRFFSSHRVTPTRAAAFAVVVLVVLTSFVGGFLAFAASLHSPTPAASPGASGHRSSLPVSTPPLRQPTANSSPTGATTNPSGTTQQQDTFHRPDLTSGWGTASDGTSWRVTDSQRQPAFSVTNNSGHIQAFLPGTVFYTATLGPSSAAPTVEDSTTFVMSGFVPGHTTNVGAVLRWQDNLTYYKAYLDGANLTIVKSVLGQQSTLTHSPFPTRNGISYTIRFRAEGHTLLAKAWESQQGEPNTWMVTTADEQLTSGNAGIRVLLAPGNLVQVASFLSVQVS